MAQVGSYVPVKSAKCGILDAIYTRMGASDDILSGCSTYMTELSVSRKMIKYLFFFLLNFIIGNL